MIRNRTRDLPKMGIIQLDCNFRVTVVEMYLYIPNVRFLASMAYFVQRCQYLTWKSLRPVVSGTTCIAESVIFQRFVLYIKAFFGDIAEHCGELRLLIFIFGPFNNKLYILFLTRHKL